MIMDKMKATENNNDAAALASLQLLKKEIKNFVKPVPHEHTYNIDLIDEDSLLTN